MFMNSLNRTKKRSFADFHPDGKAATKGGSLIGSFPVPTLNIKRRLPGFSARERVEILIEWMGRTLRAEADVTDLEPLTEPRFAKAGVTVA